MCEYVKQDGRPTCAGGSPAFLPAASSGVSSELPDENQSSALRYLSGWLMR